MSEPKIRLKSLAVKINDLFRLDPRDIVAREGWNVRAPGPALEAHIAQLAESIRAVGVLQPLTVKLKEGVIYLTDGFCRHAAVMRLIEEGVEIKSVPAIPEDPHGNEADQVLSMLTRNSGKPLEPVEMATVFQRLLAYGWDTKQIATKTGFSGSHVENLLRLLSAPPEILTMVRDGEVAASTVVEVMRAEGDNAPKVILEAKAQANAQGKTRVTPQHLAGHSKTKWSKVGPELRNHILAISRADSPDSRETALQAAMFFLQESFPEPAACTEA